MLGRGFALCLCLAALLLCAAADRTAAQGEKRLEDRLQRQQAALEEKISRISRLGERLEKAQSAADRSRYRLQDLHQDISRLDHSLRAQRKARLRAEKRYRAAAVAAYKGQSYESLELLIQNALKSGDWQERLEVAGRFLLVLREGREILEAYERHERILGDMRRQLSRKRQEYRRLLAVREREVGELRRRERRLEAAIRGLEASREATRERLRELRREERLAREAAATGWDVGARRAELALVEREKVVAKPAGNLPEEEYMRLYRRAAREYGFGEDWYVLAAVGRVESDHGRRMGPSAAGALGPMQFLPSTWLRAGVDGDGDGVANIMDPADAIPAAARYLRDAGAPEDWHAALYAYNRAGWYVREVLAVAEAYRLMFGDAGAGPYA